MDNVHSSLPAAASEPSLHRVMGLGCCCSSSGITLGTGIYALTGQIAKQAGR